MLLVARIMRALREVAQQKGDDGHEQQQPDVGAGGRRLQRACGSARPAQLRCEGRRRRCGDCGCVLRLQSMAKAAARVRKGCEA